MDKKISSHSTRIEVDLSLDAEGPRHALVSDHMATPMPKGIVWRDGHPYPAPEEKPDTPKVDSPQEALAKVVANYLDSMMDKPGTNLEEALEKAIELVFVKKRIDPDLVRVDLPYNAKQVVPGGYALLALPSGVDKVKALEIDRVGLPRALARHAIISPLRRVLGRAFLIVDAAETHVLSDIGKLVDRALETGMSTILSSAEMQRDLAPALDIRRKPAEAALATKHANENLATHVRTLLEKETPPAHTAATPPPQPVPPNQPTPPKK